MDEEEARSILKMPENEAISLIQAFAEMAEEFERLHGEPYPGSPSGARFVVGKGYERIEFFTGFEPIRRGLHLGFRNRGDALAFLRRVSMNSWDRSVLRSLFQAVEGSVMAGHMAEHQIQDILAEHLVSGRIRAVRVPFLRRRRGGGGGAEVSYMTPLEVSQAESPPPPAPQAREAPAEPPPPMTPEYTMSQEAAAAQAETAKKASQSGAPFCED